MTYTVEITESAYEAIRAQAHYIAIDCQSPLNAAKWLEAVWRAVDRLEHMPGIYNLAPEDAFRPYEIRRATVGDYFILFNIDEAARKVWVIGFRHGSRLPRPGDLPSDPPRDNA